MSDVVEELRQVIAELDVLIAYARRVYVDPPAEQMRDSTGRPLLADMISAKANALAALSRLL